MADNYVNKTGLQYFYNRIKTIFATKDYVDEYGGKINTVKVNGTALVPDSQKAVNVEIPTNVSEFTNDADYQSESQVQALIDSELADITGIDFQVVQTLPATGVKGTIYLVPQGSTLEPPYDEYIWVENPGGTSNFEKIGDTQIDLSGYWSKTELTAITTAEIDEIVV